MAIGALSKALIKLWNESDLDGLFRNQWGSDSARTDVVVLNDSEARPVKVHPRPYVVYLEREPVPVGHSSGLTPETKISYRDYPVDFQVFGSTKAQAAEFAAMVNRIYGEKEIPVVGDRFIQTLIDPDLPVREGDRTWFWLLQYRFRLERDHAAVYS